LILFIYLQFQMQFDRGFSLTNWVIALVISELS